MPDLFCSTKWATFELNIKHMKRFTLVILSLTLFAVSPLSAQLNKKEIKTYQKSVRMYEKKKYDKANELIDRVIEDHRYESLLWRAKIQYCYQDYVENGMKFNLFPGGNISVEVKGEDNDAAAKLLAQSLRSFLMEAPSKRNLRFCLREATRYCNDANLDQGNIILRSVFIDTRFKVDTGISEKALDYFYDAQDKFVEKDFNRAAELYHKALQEEPDFYKARLYRGDCYYALKEYKRAAPIFHEASDRFPDLLEPQKYYIDALMGMDEWEKGVEASIEGVLRFPVYDMFDRLETCAGYTGKSFDQKWMPRACEVNKVGGRGEFDRISSDTLYPSYWKYYKEALKNVEQFADERGVLEPNSVTEYLTVEGYAWDYMLENAEEGIEALATAREMREKGMLEPYVLISLFHYDLFDQFKHYTKHKKAEAQQYLRSLMETE